MYNRKDILDFLQHLIDEIQKQINGEVWYEEDYIGQSYIIRIKDSDVKCSFNVTKQLYKIETQRDGEKLLFEIIQKYKEYILEKYFVPVEKREL